MIKRSHASEEPSIRASRRLPTRSFTSFMARNFMTRNAAGSDPAALTPGFASLPRSNAGRFDAVGTGFGQTAFILVSTGQAIAGGLEPRRRIPRWI
jgi:hypothetical protein